MLALIWYGIIMPHQYLDNIATYFFWLMSILGIFFTILNNDKKDKIKIVRRKTFIKRTSLQINYQFVITVVEFCAFASVGRFWLATIWFISNILMIGFQGELEEMYDREFLR
jgi:uncharacterized membrane protein